MYGKIFKQMYEGSMATVGDWQAIVTFQQMIVLADKEGIVDMTAEAISRITTIPLEIIKAGIESLEQADSSSRTPDEEGRRIVRLREHCDWGWRITNYVKYSQIRSAEERRDYHRRYYHEKRKAQPESTGTQQVSTLSTSYTHTHLDTQKEEDKTTPNGVPRKTRLARARTQIPEGDWLSAEDCEFARSRLRDMDIAATFEDFRNHHTAKGTLAANWHAAWRTWVGNCVKGFAYVRLRRQSVEAAEPTYSPAEWRARQAAAKGAGG